MNCYYHPDEPSVAHCVSCGKNLCTDCVIVKENQNYCKDCLSTGDIHVDMGSIILPGLICGAVAGVVSAAPLATTATSVFSCACCLWVVLAGGFAVFLLKRWNNIKGKITAGKAGLTGGFAGFVAGIVLTVAFFLSENFEELMRETVNSPEFKEALREAGMEASEATGIVGLTFVIIMLPIIIGLALFGGLGGIISNEITK